MEPQISSRRNRRTREQIENLLSEFNNANQTVKQFCQANNISIGTFHKWQARSKGKSFRKQGGSGFAPVVVKSSLSGLFAEVKGIRLYQPVSATFLKELLR